MSDVQRKALQEMSERGIGALLVLGLGWVWPENIRQSEQAAERVLTIIGLIDKGEWV
jgi:hypothetical protein